MKILTALLLQKKWNDEVEIGTRTIVKDILSIAVPALALCLADPTLTLIDTWFIGNKLAGEASTVGLAALSANCAFFNFLACTVSFFCTGTTSIVANSDGTDEAAGKALKNGLFLSALAGTALYIVMLAFQDKSKLRDTSSSLVRLMPLKSSRLASACRRNSQVSNQPASTLTFARWRFR